MLKSYYFVKILRRLKLSSFNHCNIDKTAKVMGGSTLAFVNMGRYSYCGANTSITNTEIGNFCSIGGNCGIGGGLHPLEYVSTSPVFLKGRNILGKHFAELDYEPSKKVVIGNDVWIGSGAYIKSGVTIGDGAVIGAHAVVTHDVSPYAIVAGVPAKEIRKRFDEETIKKLLKVKWWNYEEDVLEKLGGVFTSPPDLLSYLDNAQN